MPVDGSNKMSKRDAVALTDSSAAFIWALARQGRDGPALILGPALITGKLKHFLVKGNSCND